MNASAPRLTSLAHGGGCGCKLTPSVLRELLSEQPAVAAELDVDISRRSPARGTLRRESIARIRSIPPRP